MTKVQDKHKINVLNYYLGQSTTLILAYMVLGFNTKRELAVIRITSCIK